MKNIGGVVGGVGGGLAGGLAGLLHRYTTADDNKRKLSDYLKSMLIGGGLGAGVGAVGLHSGLGLVGSELQRLEDQSPMVKFHRSIRRGMGGT